MERKRRISLYTSKFIIISIICFLGIGFVNDVGAAKTISTNYIAINTGQYKRVVAYKDRKKYRFYSSNKKVLSVNKTGKIYAKRGGKATVTAVYKKKNKQRKYIVTVTNKIKSLKVSVAPQKSWVGESYSININKNPRNSNEQILWSTSNSKVAVVQNNRVVMKGPGRASVTATTKIGKKKSTFWVTAYSTPDISVSEDGPINMEVWGRKQLSINRGDYPLSKIKFNSDFPDIVKVDNKGLLTALRPGEAIITVSTLSGKSVKIKVIVKSTNGLIDKKTLERYHIGEYDNVMVVAHPDDETLWGGADIYNKKYFVVCITNGYNKTRANEYRNLLKYTKNEGIILNYPDTQKGIRSDWSTVREGMRKDLDRIISYKEWDKIVTFNPAGVTGHIHHIMNYEDVTKIAKDNKQYDRLYYFNKFYQKNNIPDNLPTISEEDMKIKENEIRIYKSVLNNIYKFWYHMLKYEKFILAKEWDTYFENKNDTNPKLSEISINKKDIKIEGANGEHKVEILTENINVIILKDETGNLIALPDDFQAFIDVSGLGVGEHEVSLSANKDYTVNTKDKIKVKISEKDSE